MRFGLIFDGLRRPMLAALGCLLVLSPLPAYYHFLHLRHDGDVIRSIPERFDLRTLPDSSVPFVVSKIVEPEFAEGDTWESLLSEVRLAARQWSGVPHSSLRLRDAGEVAGEPAPGTPYVHVMFDELAPGVIAMAGPVSRETPTVDQNGEFVPILRSVVILSHRLRERPTYSEAFYLTLVHEMGHSLGLQHTFTGSVMSTGVTRATTKATPLAPDDYAGLAALYPDKDFAADSGVIRGRVTADGDPLHFATVTALQPSGLAVSALTLPDGRYEIRGLPPGGYYLYAQAVPPSTQDGLGPGQIVLPTDENGNAVGAGPLFATRFYPSAQDWHSAHTLVSRSGGTLDEIDINVSKVGARAFTGVTTYSFPGNFAVNPAVINTGSNRPFLVAFGNNLVENGQKAAGLRVDSTAVGIEDNDVHAYGPAPEFLQVGLSFHPFTTASGPKPLLWSRGSEVFVQPAAFRIVGQQPPDIHEASVVAGENGSDAARLVGEELGSTFTYLFDGLESTSLPVDPELRNTEITLRLPYTSDGRQVHTAALGTDGQSSLYLNANPPQVASRLATAANVRSSVQTLPVGEETMISIETDGDFFADGQIGIHFNSPHVVARKWWREAPNRVVANVFAMPSAPTGSYALLLRKDLAIIPSGVSLAVSAFDENALRLDSRLVDEITGDAVLYPGASVLLRVTGNDLPDSFAFRLGDRFLSATRIEPSLYRSSIPTDFPMGLAALQAEIPGRRVLPVAVEITERPPVIQAGEITGRHTSSGTVSRRSVRLVVELPGIAPDVRLTTALRVRVGGESIPSLERRLPDDGGNLLHLLFEISDDTPANNTGTGNREISVQVEWEGRHSPPISLTLPND